MRYGITALLLLAMLGSQQPALSQSKTVETGVSQTLAKARKQTIRDVAYALKFDIPAQKNQPIPATESISFNWTKNAAPLQLDFKEKHTKVQTISVNSVAIPIVFESEHLLISTAYLKPGANTIFIQFMAGNLSLNRNDEYLYTLLVPDRARTVFPCFDQPDLKAKFQLSLTIPNHWQAMTNAAVNDSTVTGDRKTIHFRQSEVIPTYLFSFAAGKFTSISRTLDRRPMTLFHRETDTTKIRLSLDPIFKLHADALNFLEDYTQIPYPFQKFDFVAVPDFQYGGMEHVGAIDYRLSSLFLDNGATRDQKLSRATLISHETAHMWFGDLVTMRWFNDVWLKEVFANFMADKITEVSSPEANYDLQFVVDHFPAAYAVDRTEGANPIGQPLANLQEAGTLYGGIIYHKAPIMMRQLERLMGKTALRDGLRDYLKKYSFGNATWNDLISILDTYTPADLQAWNKVWVNETGRPRFSYQWDGKGGTIKQFVISQQGEDGSNRFWPQSFEIAFVYRDHREELTVHMDKPQVVLKEAIGKRTPLFVTFNSSGQGYGIFPVDTATAVNLEFTKNPVTRAATYINLYENMVSGQGISPEQMAFGYQNMLRIESEELNLRLITSQLSDIFWNFTRPEKRPALAASIEQAAWQAMEQEPNPGKKKLLFRLYQNIALSTDARDRLYAIWRDQKAPAGVTLTEDDYTSLALALAVRDYPAEGILAKQLARIKNPDRKKRLEFMMPALSSNVAERDQFFASLATESNREHEAWVTAALGYLHHPLRTETSAKYLPKSLELLEEIQRTGDIFFPESWLRSTLSSYQTPETVQLIRKFLADRPNYNPRLRAKLLQAADGPFRASKLLYHL
ncbi:MULTISPECIES: M1 family aminopeptidase [unclassified Spirosoma]|uniref:M1 family metallopeptidase n=1 Tax=unclassified Spirosoma TaxID=2621999 RepID=UPI001ACDD6E9|nr:MULTISPECIES: M1 family aminopeptidase [unclassified Spirosoma]MBN8823530.1 aminopeptidase [Spirosoma sp.]